MKISNKYLSLLIIIFIVFAFVIDTSAESEQKYHYSPFSGRPTMKKSFQKAVMAVIENSSRARPQAALNDASIVYEYLVEGGITRFAALYWQDIPNKIGPIRSARPYLIETARSYDAILLHAGASPEGFKILQNEDVEHLDQIYNGNYYWRGSEKKSPHNLYTGYFKISDYLKEITGQEYKARFKFQEFSFIDTSKIDSEEIIINYWGNYNVNYKYNMKKNNYKRYIYDFETPHMTLNNKQIEVDNIIIKFVNTEVKDKQGRLKMDINGTGKAYYFHDGIFSEGRWQKEKNEWTKFYNNEDELITLNPGKTWIQVLPQSADVIYRKSGRNAKEN